MQENLTLGGEGHGTLTEKKSEFIATAYHVESEEEAMALVAQEKKRYADARHTVFAYYLLNCAQRYSDDGEPQGSAGMPVLDILKRGGITDALVTVTRYFGGILLGTGGLVHAYSGAAKLAVEDAGIVRRIPYSLIRFSVDYSLYQRILYELPQFTAEVDESDFGEAVRLLVSMPAENADAYLKRLVAMSNGKVNGVVEGEKWGFIPL